MGVDVEPISQNARGRRTYSVDELLSLREKNQGPNKSLKLPDKINRNLLEPSLRKRKYPFVTENQRRKSGDANSNRWEGKQGKWRDKHRKDIGHIDDVVEEDEHDEQRDPNEPDPDWADVDEEKIKRDVKNFQFQALDRVAERKLFKETGTVPDKPKLAPKEEPKTTEEKNLVDSLFRKAAGHNSMPQLPENAVDANQIEKSGNSMFGSELDKGRSEEEPLRTLGLFDFAGLNRDANNDGDPRDDMRGFGAQDLRSRDLSRPFSNHLGDRGDYGRAIGERSPIMGASPHRSPPQASVPDDSGRVADYDLGAVSRLNEAQENRDPRKGDKDLPKGLSNTSPSNENENVTSNNQVDPAKTTPPVKGNMDPVHRLHNILYEITDPVRPCVGGQFFAPARPLTNKELYDYSPKFKEIQDRRLDSMRHKQMMRHSMNQHRKRVMMAKYAQAKQMYERYPAKYGPDPRRMDYRKNEYEPAYGMKRGGGPPY